MEQEDFNKMYDRRVKQNNELIDQYNKATKWAFLIAIVLLISVLSFFNYLYEI